MTTLSLSLAIALVVCLILWLRRERFWTQRWEKAAKSLGLRARDADQLVIQAESMARDLQHAGQLAGQRQVFESLLDEISQGLVLVDDELRICHANRPLQQLLNLGGIRSGRSLITEIRDHQITDLVREAIQQGRHATRRIQVLHGEDDSRANLGGRCFVIEAAPLPASAGGGAWLMLQDVTEAALTEQIRKDFVANASHELRTPLTVINGYIEMLQDGSAGDADTMRKCLNVMEKHGKRVARIIEDMLSISRLEDSGTTLNHAPFPVLACARDAADHLAPLIESKSVRIEHDFPADGGVIDGDRFYWEQIFINLIENSIKENPRPGLVIRISGTCGAEHCVIKVSDNGIGIPAHDLPFVFKRFYRGGRHHSSQVKGTGLGLSIVKRAVEAHGGTIELSSTPGVETTFTMRVPLRHTRA